MIKARLDGSDIDDRYLFLKDLLEITKLGMCRWETSVDSLKRPWYVLMGHGKGSVKIAQEGSDTPNNHRFSSLFGEKCYTVKYPFGSFVVYSGKDDKLVYDLFQELLTIIKDIDPELKEFRLASVVKFLFGGSVETPHTFISNSHLSSFSR